MAVPPPPPPRGRENSASNDHRPAQPSALRQSHTPPNRHDSSSSSSNSKAGSLAASRRPFSPPSYFPSVSRDRASRKSADTADETTPLVQGYPRSQRAASVCPPHPGACAHGSFSPRPSSPANGVARRPGTDSIEVVLGPERHSRILDNILSYLTGAEDWKRWLQLRIRTKKISHSSALAQQAGFRFTPLMYLAYYVPFFNWIGQYKLSFLKGDLAAALTIASIYLPIALSLASNLAHVPPIHGLYSYIFNPLIYAILGSCSQMVVGPEAPGSLLVGSVIQNSIETGQGGEYDDLVHAKVCGVVAGVAGATVLISGIARLGFLDNVLSRPFLRGFISAIGFVIAVDQLIPELGLAKLAKHTRVSHGSSVDKIRFIIDNAGKVHHLTFAIAGISFMVIMIFRQLKKSFEPRMPSIVLIPDRFLVVIASAVLCWYLRWDEKGVEVLGTVKSATGSLFTFRWPFQLSHMRHIRDAMSTSFLIALLGFFESSVAAKSLGGSDTIQGMELSANREMIALGAANLVGASFMSLPAFGGYGRSKVNKSAGGKSPMSSIFLSLISLLSVLFLLPAFHHLPKPVLSSMITVVAWSLMEEAPHEIAFFVRIRGWKELTLMAIIFLATVFYSITLGMALGAGISILLVIKHSTRPRIQILGRIPGTNRFENAEADDANLEFVEGCLIVKIPEPLTFANTGELKARLRRLELYGTSQAHPAMPRIRSQESNRNIIFDIHGVTSMDGSGTQVLEEIVRNYRDRGVRIFFSRGPVRRSSAIWQLLERSGIVALCGGESHFVPDVEEALRFTEYEESTGMGSVDSNGGSGYT